MASDLTLFCGPIAHLRGRLFLQPNTLKEAVLQRTVTSSGAGAVYQGVQSSKWSSRV